MEQKLRQMLEQVHDEIKQIQDVDDKAVELLKGLRDDIEGILEPATEEITDRYESVTERLEDAVEHFEISHPTLSTVMSRLVDALNAAQL